MLSVADRSGWVISRDGAPAGRSVLLAEAADVDTSLVSRARGQTSVNDKGIVSVSSFTTRLSDDD